MVPMSHFPGHHLQVLTGKFWLRSNGDNANGKMRAQAGSLFSYSLGCSLTKILSNKLQIIFCPVCWPDNLIEQKTLSADSTRTRTMLLRQDSQGKICFIDGHLGMTFTTYYNYNFFLVGGPDSTIDLVCLFVCLFYKILKTKKILLQKRIFARFFCFLRPAFGRGAWQKEGRPSIGWRHCLGVQKREKACSTLLP